MTKTNDKAIDLMGALKKSLGLPDGAQPKSVIETPWAVKCREHGQVFLSADEYTRQLGRPDSLWLCYCGASAEFDDGHLETFDQECRYLGNLAVEMTRGVMLRCDDCMVSWTGCAAAVECPECGKLSDYWHDELDEEMGK